MTVHRRLALTLLALPAVLLLAGCGNGPDVTRPRVEGSVGPAFAHLYAQRTPLRPAVEATDVSFTPECHRSTPGTHDVGPGADWICIVTYVDSAGEEQDGKLEVQVHSNSCWTAAAASKLVGTNTLTDGAGRVVPNPVFEFDGCFDPSA